MPLIFAHVMALVLRCASVHCAHVVARVIHPTHAHILMPQDRRWVHGGNRCAKLRISRESAARVA